MSVGKLISSKIVIDQFLEYGEDSGNLIPQFHRWVKKCDFNIGTRWSYEREIMAKQVNKCFLALPDSAIHVLGIVHGDHGTDCDTKFNSSYQNNYTSVNTVGEDVIYNWATLDGNELKSSQWSIQNNEIVFECDWNEEYVTVDFLKQKTDSEGFIMINEHNVEACLAFLELRMARKQRYKAIRRKQPGHALNASIQDLSHEYHRLVRQARGYEGDFIEHKKEIAKMLNHPLKGFGNVFLMDLI